MAKKNPAFSDRLVQEIRRHGWSKRDFAEKVGIHENSVGKYTKRGGVPEWDILLLMANALGCSTDWLLTGEGPKISNESNIPASAREASTSSTILNRREEALVRAVRFLGTDYAQDVYFSVMRLAKRMARERKLKKEEIEALDEELEILGKAAME